MLPSTLHEFQLMTGNSRHYDFTLLSPRNFADLDSWQNFFEVALPYPPDVPDFSKNRPALLCAVLFVLCLVSGAGLFGSFQESLEKGVS